MDNALMTSTENEFLTLLYFDGIILAFPQKQIHSIKDMEQVNTLQAGGNSTATLANEELNLPVYTLDHDLILMQKTAENNSFCIVIKHPKTNEYFALTCDSVKQNIDVDHSAIKAIPPLMHNHKSPVIGLLNLDNSLVLISNEEKMYTYINAQEEAYV